MRIAIDKYLNDAKEAIIKDQRDKGIYSSGKSADSLKTQSTDTKGQLTGSSYFTQQFQGRAPGKFPPIEAIIQWIQIKGIQKKDNISDRSLAFLIARKIANSGTDIFSGKRRGIDIKEIAKQGIPELMKAITTETMLRIVRPLREMKKTAK